MARGLISDGSDFGDGGHVAFVPILFVVVMLLAALVGACWVVCAVGALARWIGARCRLLTQRGSD